MSNTLKSLAPVGWRGAVAWAANDARPGPLRIEECTFATAEAARAWVEEARAVAADPSNFACSVVAVYGAPL
jgi:NAD(P)H-dependent flavin oxidoreductase YrpB (nitropropane dioxygenase family)